MIGSYEIEFIGEGKIGKIVKEAVRTDRIEEFEEWENGFRVKLSGARRKLTIVCRGDTKKTDCRMIVNSPKLPERGRISINADRIARRYGSTPEITMLGTLARLGVVDIGTLMSVVYREFGYLHAVAVRRGYEEIKI